MAQIDWTTAGPLIAKILADFLAAERSRSGLTDEQIFERNGVKYDANTAKMLEDYARLGVEPPK